MPGRRTTDSYMSVLSLSLFDRGTVSDFFSSAVVRAGFFGVVGACHEEHQRCPARADSACHRAWSHGRCHPRDSALAVRQEH